MQDFVLMTDAETLSNSAAQEPFSNSYILLRRPFNLIPDYCSLLAPEWMDPNFLVFK
jgi:hypothetical protein